jgi:hypothetical protein
MVGWSFSLLALTSDGWMGFMVGWSTMMGPSLPSIWLQWQLQATYMRRYTITTLAQQLSLNY